jgi:hypothetical protein
MAFAKSFLGQLDRARPANTMTDATNLNRLILDAGWISLEIDPADLPGIGVEAPDSGQ